MQLLNGSRHLTIDSSFLKRKVEVDFFLPKNVLKHSLLSLLLINDGQNLAEMNFRSILESLCSAGEIEPLLAIGIHAGERRTREFGIASQADYLGRGIDAERYTSFLLAELLPFLQSRYHDISFKDKAVAGFSLGGLTALDIVWNHPEHFSKAGVFSGSFWWRSVDQNDSRYNDNEHRIMPRVIGKGTFHAGQKFFFQCGGMDETLDRNNNGIIDSIDDTMAVINELKIKGYKVGKDIHYLEIPDGRHDITTWEEAIPDFLRWGWGLKKP